MKIRSTILSGLAAIVSICCLGAQPLFASVSATVQPQNPLSLVGSNLTFTAQTTITAGETITGYTWKLSTNNQAPFITIPGATNSSFTITNVQITDAAYYFVSLIYNSGTNTGLQVSSAVSQLTVHDQARFTLQPQGSLVRATGGTASFNAAALGAQPLSYQWRINGTNLAGSGRINGAATNALTITGLLTSDSGSYDLVISNTYGAVTSQVASLSVLVPPFIASQPGNLVVLSGNNAVFSVTPGGSLPMSFQWKKGGSTLFNSGRFSGVTSSVLTITGALTNDNGNYTLFMSNPVGSTSSIPANLLVLIPPVITSSNNATGQQGFFFYYTATATGSAPITFGADGLPAGLSIVSSNGVISGIPAVSGVFNVTLYATNAALTASTNLVIALVTGVPGITSSLSVNGQQGVLLTYVISASNNPVLFSASGLPPGVNLDPLTGIISGPSLVSGSFPVTIGASNQYGADSQVLTLNLATAVPVIFGPLTAAWTENRTNFIYNIRAINSPVIFGASGLPLGLVINTNTGVISGTPLSGGTNNVLIWAANAYGIGSNTLQLQIAYAQLPGLAITDVSSVYSKPYLLDFTFSLRDDPNAVNNSSLGNAVVRPPEQLSVVCLEGDVANETTTPIGNETAFIVNRAINVKQLKTFLVLDYSFSMFTTPGAIDAMQASVEGLINEEPASAKFGVFEFSADYVAPKLVTGFTSDKVLLTQDIQGIQTNFVNGDYAGTRFYDALAAALTNFTSTNLNEEHYLIVMSDGYDDSSVLTTNKTSPTLPDVIVNLAKNNSVKIYCVGFGPNPNTNVLQYLTSGTQGHYYGATTPASLATQFALLLKDLNSQYLLRWATLKRAAIPFQPMFTVSVGGASAPYNTNWIFITNTIVDTNMSPPVTNIISVPTSLAGAPFYDPTQFSNNVQVGALTLAADSDTNISSVTLRAFYVPRFVREIKVHYNANYPCTASLLSTGPGDILSGWSLTQTNDATGGQWLTLASPALTNVLTSLPYGIMGDLVNFQFHYQAVPNPQQAFNLFTVDNTIYSNLPPSGQSFTLTNSSQFVTTNYPPTPPFGTPIPWLISYGFTNNFAAAELLDPNGNGFTVWQDYIAGLNPTNVNSKFVIQLGAPQSGQPPMITFNTALGRTYRVDTALQSGSWTPLLDNIAGTGGSISIPDNRNLSGVSAVYYRVVVFYY